MYRTLFLTAACLAGVSLAHAGSSSPPGVATVVQFQTTSNVVSETDGLTQLSVELSGPDPFNSTSVDVVLISGNAARIDNYTTQTVTWPANDASLMFVNITLTNNTDCDGNADLVFELQNPSGGSGVIVGLNSQFTLTVTDDDILVDSDNDAIPDCNDPCPLAVDGIANFNTVTCNCDPGYYQVTMQIGPNTVVTGCSQCPAGTYCPDGIQSIPCPAGRYSDQPGQSACAACAAGTFNPSQGATSCQSCLAGSFNATPGATFCQPCAAGSFSAADGAISCQLCAPGEYSDVVGASSCQLCDAGTFNPLPGATECQSCPAGTFGDLPGQTACQDCAEGSFNPNTGATACQPCPPGAFSDVTGAVACQLCTSGTFNPNFGAIECQDCPLGTNSGVGAIECTPIGGCQDVFIELHTDAAGAETSWEIAPYGGGAALCSGSGYGNNMSYTETCCLPDGDYILTFFDSMGDGMCCSNGFGGYRLTNINGDRIIDDWNDGTFGSTSAASQPFTIPLGTDHLIFGDCDREDWLVTEFIVASPNPAVSAEWGVGDQTDDGYQFWFFDPDGGYSRRILRNHASSGGFGPAGPTRACHLRLNSMVTLPVPYDVLLNVRVRSLVNGAFSAFGPACRFLMPSSPSSCPTTQLIDNPANPNYSCGVNRAFGGSDKVYCYPVSGANRYKWSFRNSNEGFLRNITSTVPGLVLNWVTLPLVDGGQYWVLVQASLDGGAIYCPFGDSCMVTIDNPSVAPDQRNAMLDNAQNIDLFPNPNNGDQVYLTINDLPEGAVNVNVEIFDMYGKHIMGIARTADDGLLNTVIELDASLTSGLYLVTVSAGDRIWTKRLLIQR